MHEHNFEPVSSVQRNARDILAEKRSSCRVFPFFLFFFSLSSLPPTIQRDRLSAAAASGVGHVGRVALIDVQKIRLTHLAATSRIPMRNITLTNDFRRCVKRSHCSAAEVGR